MIRFEVPLKTASTINLREHHMARYRRQDGQKRAIRAKCPGWGVPPFLVVCLTRVAPRALDDDNLRGALKSCRDAVASWLRVDDRTPLVHWAYAQEKGKAPMVRVEVLLTPRDEGYVDSHGLSTHFWIPDHLTHEYSSKLSQQALAAAGRPALNPPAMAQEVRRGNR